MPGARSSSWAWSFSPRARFSCQWGCSSPPAPVPITSIIRAAEILIQTAFPKRMIVLKSGMAVNSDAHYQHLIEYLIAGTINFLLLKNNPLPEPANSLRQILRNSGGQPLGVQDAAAKLAVSRNQLCNQVKNCTGMSAKEFMTCGYC